MRYMSTEVGLGLAVAVACVGVWTCPAPADVMLSTPLRPDNRIEQGQAFSVEWSWTDGGHELQLWHGNATSSEMLAPCVPACDGEYVWDSSGAMLGWHAFGAWVNPGGGGEWYYIASPDWLEVREAGSVVENPPPVEFMSPPAQGVTANAGEGFNIEWVGGGDDTLVQLWAGSPEGWQALGEEASGQGGWVWDTSGVAPGSYAITAWCNEAGSPYWYSVAAPGPLTLVPEPATVMLLVVGACLWPLRRRR